MLRFPKTGGGTFDESRNPGEEVGKKRAEAFADEDDPEKELGT